MSKKYESSIALYLAQLVEQIRSTRFSDEDRLIIRQHLLDAIASAFVGCGNPVFQDLIQLCPRIMPSAWLPWGELE